MCVFKLRDIVITELWLNSDSTSMHPSIKCSPRSSTDDEYETYEDFDLHEADDHDDPLRFLVPVKQELWSPADSRDSALDVKPNVRLLEANLAAAGKPGQPSEDAEVTTSEVRVHCSKLGIDLNNAVQTTRAGTEEEDDVDVDASDGDSSQKAKLHLCEDCGVLLSTAVTRLRHRCSKFKCGDCDWRGPSQALLQAHQREQHDAGRPHSCPECKARFTEASSLRQHSRMHAKGTTTCACPLCGANFNTVHNLSRHLPQCRLRSGSGPSGRSSLSPGHGLQDTKPFLCKLCLATFWHQSQVQRHVRAVHTLRKPFKCRVCVSSFASQRILNNHVKQVHSMPRPYTCSVCFMRYGEREELMQHLQVHLVSSPSGRKVGVDKMSALAVKKEVGEDDRERRMTRSVSRSSTASGGSALDNIKTYASDSD
ncbi:zinc finger protein Xfin-like isoform X2 [Thrips palmi]|uniref:Zinc finger protein Xfin-like isoform X2 n=1 Tax=Thrips palmi TaxID=161013 RepID=A0A6P8ZUU2_THRPL|nr:zinc finger protein Xfin-like isoform X2 [Thrips palmi]